MIKTILQKCIEELKKEAPRLDYITGILETLLEMQPKEGVSFSGKISASKAPDVGSIPTAPAKDEAEVLDAKARASLQTIQALAGTPE